MDLQKPCFRLLCATGAVMGLAFSAAAASAPVAPSIVAQQNAAAQFGTFFSLPPTATVPQPTVVPPAAAGPTLPSATPAPYQSQIPNLGGTPNAPGPSVGGPSSTPVTSGGGSGLGS